MTISKTKTWAFVNLSATIYKQGEAHGIFVQGIPQKIWFDLRLLLLRLGNLISHGRSYESRTYRVKIQFELSPNEIDEFNIQIPEKGFDDFIAFLSSIRMIAIEYKGATQ